MKKAILFAVTALITSYSFAQEITKDGFGPLPWGASVADAEKAFPGCTKEDPLKRPVPTQGDNRWMVSDGIPCDLKLFPKPGQANPSVELYFYDGKLVGVTSAYYTKVPSGAVGDSFSKELTQRTLKALEEGADKVAARVMVEPSSAQPPRTTTDVNARLQVWNKELTKAAMEDIRKRIEKQKNDLLTEMPKALLNP
jgi:hypothetical protein